MSTKRTQGDGSIVVRFAGDSGDGIQLLGGQFTNSSSNSGNNLMTLPDFPAEIRAPIGTQFGVSAFQIQLGASEVKTAGDEPDVLVAFNCAALAVNIKNLNPGSMVLVDSSKFTKRDLVKASLDENPIDTHNLRDKYQLIEIDISALTKLAVKESGISSKQAMQCKNFWTLGYILWLFSQDRKPVYQWLEEKFKTKSEILEANKAALNAGHIYAETSDIQAYTNVLNYDTSNKNSNLSTITGTLALAEGLKAAKTLSGISSVFCSYPITPASPLLHQLSSDKKREIPIYQAEDEIAAICAAIGVSYAGKLGITSSSGPGIALKGEAMGLAIAAELPLIIINTQRGGPSTGLPTKVEQSDLNQALYGRNGDAPLPVLSASTPKECFEMAISAVRIALAYMTPVIFLSDSYLANSSTLWEKPSLDSFDKISNTKPKKGIPLDKQSAFKRNDSTLGRQWIIPGMADGMYRTGGLEKDIHKGTVSYDEENHQKMTDLRQNKIDLIKNSIPVANESIESSKKDLLVISWGSTYGAVSKAVTSLNELGDDIGHLHISYINPLQRNIENILLSYKKVVICELNNGQMAQYLSGSTSIKIDPISKVSGQPFKVSELKTTISNVVKKIQEEV